MEPSSKAWPLTRGVVARKEDSRKEVGGCIQERLRTKLLGDGMEEREKNMLYRWRSF